MSTKFASKPSCDGKKFFIEVTGIQHSAEQDFSFYDLSDMTQQEKLEQKKAIDPELDDTTVYSWDWCDENANRNVWLTIQAEGKPIKLPLFQNVSYSSRKTDEQDYLIHAVLPLTLLPTFEESHDYKERLAPTRAGFIYVFYNHKVWREIEIRPEDDGSMSFKDVDLYQYRAGHEKPFKLTERVATGASLKELWLPAKENNRTACIHLGFSEVQWSAERLNYLEENQGAMKQRLVAFHALNIESSTDVLKAKDLPEMRVGSPEAELFLAEPKQLNHDLSGAWLQSTYQAIKNDISSARQSGESAVENFKLVKPYQYEYAIKQSVLQELLNSDSTNADNWRAEACEDFLQDARQRCLRVIVLDDPLFDLRHHSFLTQSAVGYLQQVYVDMSKCKYYRTAELVQKFVMTEKFGQQQNPYYEFKDDIDTSRAGRFHRTLRTTERRVSRNDAKILQQYVHTLVNDPKLAQALRDLSSLSDHNAAAAHVIAGYALGALSLNIDQLDQMSQPDELSTSPYLDSARQILSANSRHPLHPILFPEQGATNLEQADYTAPEPFNDGSGYATPESLALWAKDDWIIQDEQLKVMDLAFMLEKNSNGEGAFNTERRVAGIIDGIFRDYYKALLELSKNLAEEAQVIKFNTAYAPVLGLMKATNSKFFGDITYQPIGGKEFKGSVVGVHGHGLTYGVSAEDKQYIETKKKKAPMGRLYDSNGKLMASTGKKAFNSADALSGMKNNVSAKLPLKVVVVSEKNRMAEALSQANTQRTLQDINRSGLTASNAYEKLRVPYFIVVVELINLKNSLKHFENLAKFENVSYSFANVFSIVMDLSVAIVHASNLYTQNASRLATASQKTAITMSDRLVTLFTSKDGSVQLARNINRLGLASIGAGFLTAGIAAWDSIRLFKHNDTDASVAMTIVAAGTLVTTVATGFFTTSAPLLFGMGPVAWIGIGLAVAGLMLYNIWKDTPMEEWLKNGPFGRDPSDDYLHLQDPTTAFERFVGVIFNLSAKAYRLETQTEFSPLLIQQMQALGATHVIHVDTNLAELFNPDVLKVDFYVRQAIWKNTETRSRIGFSYDKEIHQLSKKNLTVLHQEKAANGYAFFVRYDLNVPEMKSESSLFGGKYYKYTYQPIFVMRSKMQIEDAYFPTLPLDEASQSQQALVTPKFDDEDDLWVHNVVEA